MSHVDGTDTNDNNGKKKRRICIVGSGIAGLTMGWLLKRKHEIEENVTIIESTMTIGMDSTSKSCYGARMDVPLRVFSQSYYPNLVSIYDTIGVKYNWANYEFNVRVAGDNRSMFKYNNLRHWLFNYIFGCDIISIPSFSLTNLLSVKYWKIIYEVIRFSWKSRYYLNYGDPNEPTPTLREFLKIEGFSNDFVQIFLLPVFSVICTCSFDDVLNYPCDIVLDYYTSGGGILGTPQLRAYHGTEDVVNRLIEDIDRILTNSKVVSVSWKDHDGDNKNKNNNNTAINSTNNKDNGNVKVTWESNGITYSEWFDEVIMATQANSSLKILGENCPKSLRDVLGNIPYNLNRSILHTDSNLLPPDIRDFTTVSLLLKENKAESECMIWMNRIDDNLKKELSQNVFQTWNPIQEPKKEYVVVDAMLQRPLMNKYSLNNLNELEKHQGKNHLWLIGAYSLYSMPLLENGVRSSIRIANRLGVKWDEYGKQINGTRFEKINPTLIKCNNKTEYKISMIGNIFFGISFLFSLLNRISPFSRKASLSLPPPSSTAVTSAPVSASTPATATTSDNIISDKATTNDTKKCCCSSSSIAVTTTTISSSSPSPSVSPSSSPLSDRGCSRGDEIEVDENGDNTTTKEEREIESKN